METIDYVIVFAYVAVILLLGLAFLVWEWSDAPHHSTSHHYFLADRSTPWWAVGCAFFSSNIGSDAIVGTSGGGAEAGMSVAMFDWGAVFVFVLLAHVFYPMYLRSGAFTLPEFIEKRFGKSCRLYLVVVTLFLYIVRIAMALFAGELVLSVVFGLDPSDALKVLVALTMAYTFCGGLGAVIYTEVIQTGLLLISGLTLTSLAFSKVGGWTGLRTHLPDKFFRIFQGGEGWDFEFPYPWYGLLFGFPVMATFYHCTDQEMVQRVLAAKDEGHGRLGCIAAGFLKFFPPVLFILPGMIARVLYPRALLCSDVSPACEQANWAYPVLINQLMPTVLKGMTVAAMIGALMTVLGAIFNSASTIFTMDIWRSFAPNTSERALTWIGRMATVVMGLIGVVWIPLMRLLSSNMYVAVQTIAGLTASPICALFVVGIFFPRANEIGAMGGLIIGQALGIVRLLLRLSACQLVHERLTCRLGGVFVKSNFLVFAAFNFVGSAALILLMSYLGPPPRRDQLVNLTWWEWTAKDAARDEEKVHLTVMEDLPPMPSDSPVSSAVPPMVIGKALSSTGAAEEREERTPDRSAMGATRSPDRTQINGRETQDADADRGEKHRPETLHQAHPSYLTVDRTVLSQIGTALLIAAGATLIIVFN
ncbi:unnamed protein product [Vitrella brassicaformis CCMP3155]|uniref:Uncharacterized protein n=2 Tax=Vitrella brassicaformis TaxID=1169539 RepID=A0A0G4E887_VITBC|nr:unnamed protein product [Vitrella brassicaformis CCMP3155]|mmetsp:Transcript_8377/g.23826  ORF Transcript_8377/g.23826 Transcript_8377/m.23826 type:complete len:648 (+) Transcript_8377:94-2037(+)|eukprot:CEL91820.1 unnamed protein product [Vitrella brassicaformis CCMP3155]